MKQGKWALIGLMMIQLMQPVNLYAEETEETTSEQNETLSIYDIEIESNVTAGQSTALTSQAAMITNKEAKKGVKVTDTIQYSGLVPDEKYEITCQLVYYDGYQEMVVTKAMVTKKASDTGSGTWKVSLDTIKGLNTGIKYHLYEEIVSQKAFEFAEGIQKQEYTQNDPYANNMMITVADNSEIPAASKEVKFIGRDKYKNGRYAVVKLSDTGTAEETLDIWTGADTHSLILSEGMYALIEYKDQDTYEVSKSIYFHLANDGTVEIRDEDKWKKMDRPEINIAGIKKEKKKKVAAKENEETPETATYTNMVELLILLMVALVAAVKVLCSRLFTVD
ncbi:MAG: VaFE repeat-containing surface-anchored protein [Erysipelotrichaceae bacterium]|nr:VaFE repeat-containing surface-anchored protein [Erysipelotrichaceae bacterium]